MAGSKGKVEIIHPASDLKAKVFGSRHEEQLFEDARSRFQDVVGEYRVRYPGEAKRALARLADLLGALRHEPDRHACLLERVRKEAIDIMGQAETFDFPRLTWLARSLYDLCEMADREQQRELMLMRVTWMQKVIQESRTGYR